MYNLSSHFLPIEDDLLAENWQSSQIGHCIAKHTSTVFPEITNAKIAFFSVAEFEGTENKCSDFSAIRKEFYKLHFADLPPLVDLGSLQLMPTKKESFKQIEKVCTTLLENDIIPMLIGGGQDISYAIYKAYASIGKIITFSQKYFGEFHNLSEIHKC